MLFYLKIKNILKIEIVCGVEATGWHIPRMDLLHLYPLFCPWFRLLSKSDHGIDFGGKMKVIVDRLSQSVAPA